MAEAFLSKRKERKKVGREGGREGEREEGREEEDSLRLEADRIFQLEELKIGSCKNLKRQSRCVLNLNATHKIKQSKMTS